jgi:iron donor protein CyaY
MPLDEEDFHDRAEEALQQLDSAFGRLGARYPVEADFEGGVLRVQFDEPDQAVFVISPNGPARQIWVSALLKSFKFDWDEEAEQFLLHDTREPLQAAVERLAREQLGDPNLKL